VAGEPEAVAEVIGRCARLPLALGVAAARAAARPGFPLAATAAGLRDANATLDPFGGTDLATDVRAVFSWSCQALSGGAARLFRLLGLHPGPSIGTEAAASLAAVGVPEAQALLAELTGAHLLAEPSPGRYVCHDLLRAYAGEQARAQHGPQARGAAVRRVLGYYVHAAHAATALVEPNMAMFPLESPEPGVATAAGLATAADGVAWFAAEHAVLVAVVPLAADAGLATHAWQLVLGLTSDLLRRGRWDEHAAACHAALTAVRQTGDTIGEAHALMALGMGHSRSGRFRQAEPLFQQALRLLETAGGYPCSEAMAHHGLTWLAEHRQRPADMLRHTQAAHALWRAAGNQLMHVATLNDIGYCHALAGDYQQAISYCERALPAVQELGDASMESNTWHSLGHIYHQLGSYQRAIDCYERSAALSRDLADLFNEADTLSQLGTVHQSAGDLMAARRAWAQALRIFEEIGHPDAWRIRARLRAAPPPRRRAG
jgi:tetratricopeptide (TPR) repeat protein